MTVTKQYDNGRAAWQWQSIMSMAQHHDSIGSSTIRWVDGCIVKMFVHKMSGECTQEAYNAQGTT